jgi:lipopolysaccharide export system protein LptC
MIAAGNTPLRRPRPPHLQRRTQVVVAMRLILPIIAALLLAVLALWSRFGLDSGSFRLAMGSFSFSSVDSLTMSNPHFEGLDDKRQPFSVSAASASQPDQISDIIDLTAPQADLTMSEGAWLTLSADSGVFQRTAQLLDLKGQVNLFQDQGYELHTRNVHVDMAQGSASGKDDVQGQGPAGELTAQGLEVSHSGKRIRFLGRAHITFYNAGDLNAAVPNP